MALDLINDENLILAYEQIHQPKSIWPEIPLESGNPELLICRSTGLGQGCL